MTGERLAPILVIGLNRSGTKWLSNLIASHSDVFAVMHESHFGIIESNVFNDFSAAFPSLADEDARIGFTALWKETDFVRMSGVDLLGLVKRSKPATVFEAFRLLMDQASVDRECRRWLQKCSPIQFWLHRRNFPDAVKVVIRRKFDEVLMSSIENARSNHAAASEFRQVVDYAMQDRILDHISRDSDTICVDYDSLKANPEKVMCQVFEKLHLSQPANFEARPFRPNTSFENSQARVAPKLATKVAILAVRATVRLLPSSMVAWMWRKLRRSSGISIVRGTFRNFPR